MNEHFVITLHVFNKVYRLKVKRKDEKIYRDAADAIKKKTKQYRDYFSGQESNKLEDTDYMVMTSIQALSENAALETENEAYERKIKSLTEELDLFLRKYR
ncbi:cell division protein ZapA [Dysgonomonas sp. 520]|uniref:cell division protein ZapA n=1 Tax=Dysgonomonas sp. 520 TaxID=2302931 RepID=UPI0013D020AC|nr:cell division protein ZapA [Dysgonomonas sp. 520]NDW10755.1 cell division protein ZapA [Dysgonomonas sp. 520]